MRRLIVLTLLFALAAAPASAATRRVRVDDDYFVRSSGSRTVTVATGTVVKWRWRGSRRHNVLVQSGPRSFQSALKRSGSFERRMRVGGTYRIVCSIHEPDMRMKLVVYWSP